MPEHFDITRWAALPPLEQLGNIGSEVGRTMNALQRGDHAAAEGASLRALDLTDASVSSWSSESRRRELLRARELLTTAVETATPDAELDRYFFQYALAARANR